MQQQGPFDGFAGFSQGAVMSAALAAMQASGTALRGVPPLKFVLLFAGMITTEPRHVAAMSGEPLAVPSCHIIGDQDFLRKHSDVLIGAFKSPLVLRHARGHAIASLGTAQLKQLRLFLVASSSAGTNGQLPLGAGIPAKL